MAEPRLRSTERMDRLDSFFTRDSTMLNPKQLRFRTLGEADSAVVVMSPALASFVKAEMIKSLGKEAENPKVKTLIDYVFANEENYAAFLKAPDKREYLLGLLKSFKGGAPMAEPEVEGPQGIPIIPRAKETELTPTETKPTTTVTMNQTTPVLEVDTSAVTTFLSGLDQIKIDVDAIYEVVMNSPKLTESEKKQFMQMFTVLYAADKTLGQAFLLTIYTALSKEQPFEKAFPKAFEQQRRLMNSLWGPTIEGIFKPLGDMSVGSLSEIQRYMEIVYANLSLGSVLIGNYDKSIRAGFGRAFVIGFLGGITGIIDDLAVKNLERLQSVLDKNLTGQYDVSWSAPLSALAMMTAGIAASALKYTILYPAIAIQQALCINIGGSIAKTLAKAAILKDEERRLNNPYVLTAVFGILATYGNNMSGIRGISQPSFGTPQTGTVPDANVTIVATRDTVDTNTMDMFEAALKIVDKKECKTIEDIYGMVAGIHAVIYSLNTFPGQEDEIIGSDLDSDLLDIFRNMKGSGNEKVAKIEKLARYIIDINRRSKTRLDEILKIYEKEGFEGLEKKVRELEGNRMSRLKPKRRDSETV
ncbi:Uncharacterised protein [Candidatus Bilamarchaeum dharawalense]|uniref:Uncharacterized protein n=1 Tax=Candidatus Bilamarchaeum dharawalense TaxID=2885759 RepID=A0A5E4LWR5_9ARCH|nr:Uncharacterised protein [Candidatus Bilamarchaeum dharawalense]